MSIALNQSFEAIFKNIENFVTTKTVVGEPVTFGDVIIVPLIDVTFGAGAGGGNSEKSGGGGGMGAKISPSAVLVVVNGTVQMVNVKNQDSVNKLIDMFPGIMAKLGSFFGKEKKDKTETTVNE